MGTFYKIQEETLTDIADAIRERGVDVPDPLNGSAFASMIRTLPKLNDLEDVYGVLFSKDRDFLEYKGSTIQGDVFYNCSNIKILKMPNLTSMPSKLAFAYCYALEEIEMPLFSGTINTSFNVNGTTNLTKFHAPLATGIGASAFAYLTKLSDITVNNVVSVGQSAFAYMQRGLENSTLVFDKPLTIGGYETFNGDYLGRVVFNNTVSLGSSIFRACNIGDLIFNSKFTFNNRTFDFISSITNLVLNVPFNQISSASYNLAYQNSSKVTNVYVRAEDLETFQTDTSYWSVWADKYQALPAIITINGNEYNFEVGQSWEAWVESEFNTLGLIVSGNNIEDANGNVLNNSTGPVLPTQLIVGDICTL